MKPLVIRATDLSGNSDRNYDFEWRNAHEEVPTSPKTRKAFWEYVSSNFWESFNKACSLAEAFEENASKQEKGPSLDKCIQTLVKSGYKVEKL